MSTVVLEVAQHQVVIGMKFSSAQVFHTHNYVTRSGKTGLVAHNS